MALYRKYRPHSFADVVGQEHIVTTLEHAVDRDQLVHAYLFFGPRGTGKTSVARILGKILLIRGIEDEALQQRILKSVDEGTMVDLIEIDAASNRGIDDVRDLKEKVEFAPSMAAAKVYIIDEVHMMTKDAFNALLKTLEEPPAHTYFILATTELHKVPDTIQSRCQRFPFRDISEEDIIRALQNIADQERIPIDRGALRAIARHVHGGMRDAVTLLDQLSSLEKITEEDVRHRIGESAEEYVDMLWAAMDAKDRQRALEIVSSLEENGVALEVFLRQMLSRARQDLHQQIDAGQSIEVPLRRIDAVFRALKDLRVSPVPIIALEVALVDLCMDGVPEDARKAEKPKTVKQKVHKEEKKEKEQMKESPVVEQDVPASDATVMALEVTSDAVEAAWSGILSSISVASIRMSLKDSVIRGIEEGKLVLAFASQFHCSKVQETKALHEVEDALQKHFHTFVPVKCVLQDAAPVSSKNEKEEAVNMVDAVAEIFG